jgi:cytochrome P450
MVFAESLRLYPPAWAVGRMAKVNTRIYNYEVPRKSICLMSPYVMHRHPRYYPDPERFDPLRFTPEAKQDRPKFAYFPFGGGSRVCIGERFAWMEGVLVMATIAQRWRFNLVPGQIIEPHPQITLRTRHGVRMILRPAS